MDKEKASPYIFEKDEMKLSSVNKNWTSDALLQKEGIFFLKDVVKILEIDPSKVKKKAREIEKKGQSAWKAMGARKIWNHWIIRMTVFAPFYQKNLVPKVLSVRDEWDGNTLLRQKGVFFLTEVCTLIPFSTHQLRYQAKQNPNAKKEYGVWKDEELNAFVVDMERFAPWINMLWLGDEKK